MHRGSAGAAGVAVTVLIIVAAFVGSCSKPPTEEMLRAEKALAAAQDRDAHLYAADELEAARAAFAKARELVSSRQYDGARAAAAEGEELAHQAGTLAGMRREKLKTEVERTIDDLRKKLGEFREQTEVLTSGTPAARRAKNRERLAEWEVEIGTAEADIATGNLKELLERLAAIRSEIERSAGDFAKSNAKARREGKP